MKSNKNYVYTPVWCKQNDPIFHKSLVTQPAGKKKKKERLIGDNPTGWQEWTISDGISGI